VQLFGDGNIEFGRLVGDHTSAAQGLRIPPIAKGLKILIIGKGFSIASTFEKRKAGFGGEKIQ